MQLTFGEGDPISVGDGDYLLTISGGAHRLASVDYLEASGFGRIGMTLLRENLAAWNESLDREVARAEREL